MYGYYNSCFFKKDRSYKNNCGIRLHDVDLEHSLMKEKKVDVHMFFLPFLCSGIPDLALRILRMLIGVCFRDVLQPAFYQFVSGMIWLSASWYSKRTIITVNLYWLPVVVMYKKVLT